MEFRPANFVIHTFALFALALGACAGGTSGPAAGQTPLAGSPATQPPTDAPPTATPTVEPTPTTPPHPAWTEAEDPRTGVRFAVPCFWQIRVPSEEQDPSRLGAFPVTNYDDAFLEQFGDKQGDELWNEGGMKIDFVYFEPTTWNLHSSASPRELAQASLGTEGSLTEIVSLEDIQVNGQPGLEVTTRDVRSEELAYTLLFGLGENSILGLSPVPSATYDHPDIQGVLNSLAFSPEVEVAVPTHAPAPPPGGAPAPCLGEGQPQTPSARIEDDLACPADSDGALELACRIRAAVQARDIDGLQSMMRDPFTIGYWGSEGVSLAPGAASEELSRFRLPDQTDGIRFTADRSTFPSLEGTPPETMFGPDPAVALIVYSQGWGTDGQAEVLLFITRAPDDTVEWYSLLFAQQGFDR